MATIVTRTGKGVALTWAELDANFSNLNSAKSETTHTHTVAAGGITDFTEAVQDVVGPMVVGAGGTYNDGTGAITLPTGGGGGSSSTTLGAVSDVTTGRALALIDVGKMVPVNSASAQNITVPLNSAVAIPVDTLVHVWQKGVGQVTLAPTSGVTLLTSFSLTTRAQNSVVTLWKTAADTWLVWGDLV